MKEPGRKPERILIIKPSALGDVAISLPAFASLRASFPDAHIAWLVRSEYAAMLECAEGLDEIVIFDRKGLGRWWWHPGAFCNLVRFFRRLWKGHYDLVVDLQGLFRTAFFGWMTGAKRRFGMTAAREFATLFYTDRVAIDANSPHLADYYHKVVAAAGADKLVSSCNLAVAGSGCDKLSDGDYVVLVTGSAHESKCWPIERFAELADLIASRYAVRIVAVGSAGEKEAVEKLCGLAESPIVDLAGRTNVEELVSALASARLVISNDTGPGHIAAAVNVPVVMIFGPTNPMRVGPRGNDHCVVGIDVQQRGDAIESEDVRHRIDRVQVDSVFEQVAYHLSGLEKS